MIEKRKNLIHSNLLEWNQWYRKKKKRKEKVSIDGQGEKKKDWED